MSEPQSTQPLALRRQDITSPVAAALIAALNAELAELYPEPAARFRLGTQEVADAQGVFLVGWSGGGPVGCGVLRRIDAERSEIKRLFVVKGARGRGFGRCILDALEREAGQLGVHEVVVEAGIHQQAALALYKSAGYAPIEAFGETIGSQSSLCLGKRLRAG